MKLKKALEIVLDLAEDNELDRSLFENDKALIKEACRQDEAIATVRTFLKNFFTDAQLPTVTKERG